MDNPQQPYPGLSPYDQERVRRWNARTRGGTKTPRCSICGDKLFIYDTPTSGHWCECKKKHDTERMLQASGLTDKLKSCTFVSFEVREPWQDSMKKLAWSFLDSQGDWLYFGGQVGCGKTHLCSAVVNALLQRGRSVRYMVWPDEVDGIKGNADGFSQRLKKLMDIPVLYIDDFLKSPNGNARGARASAPTEGELAAAFKIVNYRYNRPDKITLFSSEYYADEVMAFDSGIASRIHERARKYELRISRDESKNQRTRA